MEAAAKRKQFHAGDRSAVDRLSALPDDLLLRVLSFLPAQQVVQTTVLSRRWVDQWRLVPGINLSFSDFRKTGGGVTELYKETWNRMENFTTKLLMLHIAPRLDAFRLDAKYFPRDTRPRVNEWIRRAIKDDPVLLQLFFRCYKCNGDFTVFDYYQLPHLCSSPSRRLKTLHLSGVSLDHSFAEQLHSWFPDLEELNIGNCRLGFSSIQSDKLMNFKVADHCTSEPADVFVIRASALTSLWLEIPYLAYKNGVLIYAGNSLMKAYIELRPHAFSPRTEAMILRGLSIVSSLELTFFQATAMLEEEFDRIPIFDNLRKLSLCLSHEGYVHTFKALERFLQKSPNLETLTLHEFSANPTFKARPVVKGVEIPVLENLRTLFLCKCDLDDNFWLLHQCLQSFPNLEKLTLRHCSLEYGFTGGERKTRSKKTYFRFTNLERIQCPKLKSIEIEHEDDENTPKLANFLKLRIASEALHIRML